MEILKEVLIAILLIAILVVSYYFDVKRKIQEEVNGYIDAAESTGEDGGRKMEMVVDKIYYSLVPAVFRPLLSKAVIQNIVQAAFDKIEDYAKKQVEKEKSK